MYNAGPTLCEKKNGHCMFLTYILATQCTWVLYKHSEAFLPSWCASCYYSLTCTSIFHYPAENLSPIQVSISNIMHEYESNLDDIIDFMGGGRGIRTSIKKLQIDYGQGIISPNRRNTGSMASSLTLFLQLNTWVTSWFPSDSGWSQLRYIVLPSLESCSISFDNPFA